MGEAQIAVLIPAYKPDERLNALTRALSGMGFRLIVVDDGSGEAYRKYFQRAAEDAVVLAHEVNRGKGAALKTALNYLLQNEPCAAVTADADGQHTPEDIALIARTLKARPDALVLGARDKRQMPLKSKCGNTLTCFVFGLVTGLWLTDTQTGLRGLPKSALRAFAALDGDRYEYELNMLLAAKRDRIPVLEVVIETIYHDNNAGSHFHPLKDGLRIYATLFRQMGKFIGSSFLAAVVDLAIYSGINLFLHDSLLLAVACARAMSSTVNYLVNRKVVFKSSEKKRDTIFRFYLLVLIVMTGSYLFIRFFTALGMHAIPAKIIADGIMFFVNYHIQNRVVFGK